MIHNGGSLTLLWFFAEIILPVFSIISTEYIFPISENDQID